MIPDNIGNFIVMSYQCKGVAMKLFSRTISPKDTSEQNSELSSRFFYTVGLPIDVQTKGIFSEPHPRARIPAEEILHSFSEEKIGDLPLRLFATEEEALEYSRSLRNGRGFNTECKERYEVSQPAVIKVIYLRESPQELRKEALVINLGFNDNPSHLPPEKNPCYDEEMRTTTVQYFECQRTEVQPLEGQLKIQYGCRGNFKIYKSVVFNNTAEISICRMQ